MLSQMSVVDAVLLEPPGGQPRALEEAGFIRVHVELTARFFR